MIARAVIVVDVQRDFCDGGSLPAHDTVSLIAPLATFIQSARRKGYVMVFTQDWHPPDHTSFVSRGGRWPSHCVANSFGAELVPPLLPKSSDVTIRKGIDPETPGYSAFERTSLGDLLASRGVREAAICGIALEFCVRATARDAAKIGLATTVLEDLVRSVSPSAMANILAELQEHGIHVAPSTNWLNAREQD